jgi:RNA polymerase sigma factor (TIGR02999 family)
MNARERGRTADPALRAHTTALLERLDPGEPPTLDQVVPLIFDELRDLAHGLLAREHRNVTLQTTALVHEAYVRLVDDARVTIRGRAYFFAAAARAMRQILIDAARRRSALKRGGEAPVVALDDDGPLAALDDDGARVDAYASELLDLNRALDELELRNPRQMRVVECRFFGGLSVEETAAALGVSPRTVKGDWALARAWLYRALRGEERRRGEEGPR